MTDLSFNASSTGTRVIAGHVRSFAKETCFCNFPSFCDWFRSLFWLSLLLRSGCTHFDFLNIFFVFFGQQPTDFLLSGLIRLFSVLYRRPTNTEHSAAVLPLPRCVGVSVSRVSVCRCLGVSGVIGNKIAWMTSFPLDR